MQNLTKINLKSGVNYQIYLPYAGHDWMQGVIFKTKLPTELDVLEDILSKYTDKDSVFIDIGMNIGNHSLFLAAHNIKCLAFEANQKMSVIAKENIKINHFEDRIKIYEYGLSDKEEKAYFAEEDKNNYGAMSLEILDTSKESDKKIIECKTLDSFGIQNKVFAMKIDVEGMEAKVLQGAKELISKNRPYIYVEDWSLGKDKIAKMLNELRYVVCEMFSSATYLYAPIEKVNLQDVNTHFHHKILFIQRQNEVMRKDIRNLKADLNSLKEQFSKLQASNTLAHNARGGSPCYLKYVA